MSSNGSFGDILQTFSVRERVMACLQLEDLSHMMIASPLLRTCCENSAAATKKWQMAVDKLNSMNKEENFGIDNPRLYNAAFDGMSLQGKFNLLFLFQHLCIEEILGYFDLGSYSRFQESIGEWPWWW